MVKYNNAGDYQWAKVWGGASEEDCRALASDQDGHIFAGGMFVQTIDLNPGTGTDYHTSNGGYDIYVSKLDASGNFYWAKTWGGAENTWDVPSSLSLDENRNIYIAGRFKSSVIDFDPGTGVENHYCNGDYDAFVSKLDSEGEFQWARTWGGAEADYNSDLYITNDNTLYFLGYFRTTVDLDPGPGEDFHTAELYSDINLSYFDQDGNYLWALVWPEGGNAMDRNADGDFYFVGSFANTVDFDPGAEVDEFTSNGFGDCVVIKYLN
jgi:hypothetical protein